MKVSQLIESIRNELVENTLFQKRFRSGTWKKIKEPKRSAAKYLFKQDRDYGSDLGVDGKYDGTLTDDMSDTEIADEVGLVGMFDEVVKYAQKMLDSNDKDLDDTVGGRYASLGVTNRQAYTWMTNDAYPQFFIAAMMKGIKDGANL